MTTRRHQRSESRRLAKVSQSVVLTLSRLAEHKHEAARFAFVTSLNADRVPTAKEMAARSAVFDAALCGETAALDSFSDFTEGGLRVWVRKTEAELVSVLNGYLLEFAAFGIGIAEEVVWFPLSRTYVIEWWKD